MKSPFPEDLTDSFEPLTGSSVTLRPLRREDCDIEFAFVSGLSPETRANRLLGGTRAITREYIESLVSVDYSRDMALAATTLLGGSETLIGVARYVRENGSAEFAIVVLELMRKLGFALGRQEDATLTRATLELRG